MEEVFLSKSTKNTQTFAQDFAKKLHPGDVLLLYGNLGAGKTTFVQGLAKGLGVEKRIISPTFIIMRTYTLPKEKFYHIDLFRLENEKEIADLGLLEILEKKKDIVVIEWPEKLGNFLPKNAWEISFKTTGENEREITIKK